MGLLDEAIREHLELKRRRGADPSAIAREEREALAPVFPDELAEDDGDCGCRGARDLQHRDRPRCLPLAPPTSTSELADLSAAGQETAELDMQAVMDADLEAADSASTVGAEPVPASPAEEMSAEESLDWEFRARRRARPRRRRSPGRSGSRSSSPRRPSQVIALLGSRRSPPARPAECRRTIREIAASAAGLCSSVFVGVSSTWR
jgi:hypothetical protein